jgi:hypothetical protein
MCALSLSPKGTNLGGAPLDQTKIGKVAKITVAVIRKMIATPSRIR